MLNNKAIKALYITAAQGKLSETFIHDNIAMLKTFLDMQVISLRRSSLLTDAHHIGLNKFWYARPTSRILRTILNLFQFDLLLYIQQRKFTKQLKEKTNTTSLILFEYANSAISCLPYITNTDHRRIIVFVHGRDITAFRKSQYDTQLKELLSSGILIITASNHMRRRCILYGASSYHVTVVPLAIRNKFTAGQVKSSFPSIVSLGRLTEKKNPLPILHSIQLLTKMHPDIKYIVIGGGHLEGELKQRTKQLGIQKHVEFLGEIDHNTAMKIMSECWIFVQHSATAPDGDQEGFALSLAEAGLLGLPVVATLHNGIKDHIQHNETGLLYQEHDFEHLTSLINELVSNRDLRMKLAKNRYDFLIQNYNQSKRSNALHLLICRQYESLSHL